MNLKNIINLCFLCIMLCCSHFVKGQNYRIIYLYKYSDNQGHQKEELYNLDVYGEDIAFYPKKMEQIDSIYDSVGRDIYKMPRDLVTYSIYKIFSKYNIKEPHYKELKFLDNEYYLVQNAFPQKYEWRLLNEEKKENEILLQKANITFGGRHWEAWYNAEIPLVYGPYIFKNLPGLIFQMKDAENKYDFQLISIEKKSEPFVTHTFFETDFGNKRPVYSAKNFIKLKQNLYLAPIKRFNEEWEDKNAEKVFINQKTKAIREMLKEDDILNFYTIEIQK